MSDEARGRSEEAAGEAGFDDGSGMSEPIPDDMAVTGAGADGMNRPTGDGTWGGVDMPAPDSDTDAGADMSGGPPSNDDGPEADGADERPQRRCATMAVHHRLLAQVPSYAAARSRIEDQALHYMGTGRATARTGVATIPVVVHIVYNSSDQNISDSQIQSQLGVLNEDFRALNPDVSQVPTVFQPFVADPQMQFVLATKDPDGNAHSGVIRTATTVESFGSTDEVKFSASGGSDAWPADRYLNMWVCRLSGGLLGYAQFPGGPANTDGVVIRDTAFGTTGTAAAPFNRGRTTTHEVGHYLNVFHIWGDDGTGCGGSDQVSDTPNQGGPNYGTPSFPTASCNNGPNGDMFMNYMDYVDDASMVMFTSGQVGRMNATLEGPRAGLASDGGRTPASGPAVAWSSDRLDSFVIGTDSRLYHKWFDGSGWGPSPTGYENMGGQVLSNAEAVAWGPNRLDVFVVGTNSSLHHKWWDGSGWGPSVTGYENMGGVIRGNPKAVAWGSDRLDVFVIGTNHGLYHKWWNGSAWGPSVTGYEFMGGRIISDPEAVAWGPDRLDVFVVGTDSSLYHKWWNGSAWGPSVTGYENMGGRIHGNPKAVAWGPDRLDVFVKGMDHGLHHKWWNGSAWGPSLTGYEHLGGTFMGDPEVVSWGPNRLDVFVVGTDSRLHHKWWDGSSWGPSVTGWEDLGGTIIGQPHAVCWGSNRIDVFVIGTSSAMHHKWWDGSGWGPSVTGYEYQGGSITDF